MGHVQECQLPLYILLKPLSCLFSCLRKHTGGGNGGISIGGGTVNPGELVHAPVFVTEFVYDSDNNVKLVVDEMYDEATSYIGAYDKSDRLVELQEVTFNNDVAFTHFTAEGIESYKVFIWEDMVPLCVSEEATHVEKVTMDVVIALADIVDINGRNITYLAGEEKKSLRLTRGEEGVGIAYNGAEVGRYTDYNMAQRRIFYVH